LDDIDVRERVDRKMANHQPVSLLWHSIVLIGIVTGIILSLLF